MNHKLWLMLLIMLFQISLKAKEEVDYIIIGVGTAGAVLAKKLSDNQRFSVIALHEGKDLQENSDIKYTKNALFTVVSALFGSSFYQTGQSIPQPNANNRELFWAVALPEGGASSINAGAWCRGTNEVFEEWEAIAGPEWSPEVILDVYKSLENYNGTTTNPAARGFNGGL